MDINTLLLAVLLAVQLKGLKIQMNEKQTLDTILGFITDPLTPFINRLIANQKDPADQAEADARKAEEEQILTALQGLVPAAPETGG